MSEETKKPSLAARAGGAFGKVKRKVIPVRTVVLQKKSQAISSIKREASNYAAARREEERIKQERVRHVRGIVREENRVAEEAYLQGGGKGSNSRIISRTGWRISLSAQGRSKEACILGPFVQPDGDLGILAPSPKPTPGKKKAAPRVERPSMLNGSKSEAENPRSWPSWVPARRKRAVAMNSFRKLLGEVP